MTVSPVSSLDQLPYRIEMCLQTMWWQAGFASLCSGLVLFHLMNFLFECCG